MSFPRPVYVLPASLFTSFPRRREPSTLRPPRIHRNAAAAVNQHGTTLIHRLPAPIRAILPQPPKGPAYNHAPSLASTSRPQFVYCPLLSQQDSQANFTGGRRSGRVSARCPDCVRRPRADAHPNSSQHTDSHPYQHARSNSHPNSDQHPYTHPYQHARTYAHPNSHLYACADSHPNSLQYTYAHPDINSRPHSTHRQLRRGRRPCVVTRWTQDCILIRTGRGPRNLRDERRRLQGHPTHRQLRLG